MKSIILALALAFGLAASQPALAQQELGPAIGARAPAFSVTRVDGKTAKLANIVGKKGVTLVLFRSADWCPYCKAQLKDLNTVAADMTAKGWPIVAVSYDPAKTLKDFAAKEKLTYPLMSDIGSKTIDAFGVRNQQMIGSGKFDGIPYPIILFIGADGVVKSKLYEDGFKKRPPAKLVLETAGDLN
jgi:peroxiredoxin